MERVREKRVDDKRDRPHLTPVSVVLPAKRDGVVGDVDEPMVGDGHPMRVARKVVEHVGRTAKGRLGVHDPCLAIERSEERARGRVGLQRGQRAREIKTAVSIGVPQSGHES